MAFSIYYYYTIIINTREASHASVHPTHQDYADTPSLPPSLPPSLATTAYLTYETKSVSCLSAENLAAFEGKVRKLDAALEEIDVKKDFMEVRCLGGREGGRARECAASLKSSCISPSLPPSLPQRATARLIVIDSS